MQKCCGLGDLADTSSLSVSFGPVLGPACSWGAQERRSECLMCGTVKEFDHGRWREWGRLVRKRTIQKSFLIYRRGLDGDPVQALCA
jgi:hypothetical protein